MKPAEFDSHAAHYDGGLDNPIKRLMGSSPDQFIAVKARWLLRREPGLAAGSLAVLDYGCGAGDLLRVLAGLGARAAFTGCDVSIGMLAEVEKRWPAALELGRVLKPGGRIYVFEHNPRNPLVRYVIARTPIDENAILLDEKEVRHGLLDTARYDIASDYLMFTPPGIAWLRGVDRALAWLPLGAQYVVAARKGA